MHASLDGTPEGLRNFPFRPKSNNSQGPIYALPKPLSPLAPFPDGEGNLVKSRGAGGKQFLRRGNNAFLLQRKRAGPEQWEGRACGIARGGERGRTIYTAGFMSGAPVFLRALDRGPPRTAIQLLFTIKHAHARRMKRIEAGREEKDRLVSLSLQPKLHRIHYGERASHGEEKSKASLQDR